MLKRNYPKWCVYESTHPSGFYYFGKGLTRYVRTGCYKGSGKELRKLFETVYPKYEWTTVILSLFDAEPLDENGKDPGEMKAYALEKSIITDEMLLDPLCVNKVRGGHGGWKWKSVDENKRRASIKAAMARPEIKQRQKDGIKKAYSDPALKSKLSEKVSLGWEQRRCSEEYINSKLATQERYKQEKIDRKNKSEERKFKIKLKRILLGTKNNIPKSKLSLQIEINNIQGKLNRQKLIRNSLIEKQKNNELKLDDKVKLNYEKQLQKKILNIIKINEREILLKTKEELKVLNRLQREKVKSETQELLILERVKKKETDLLLRKLKLETQLTQKETAKIEREEKLQKQIQENKKKSEITTYTLKLLRAEASKDYFRDKEEATRLKKKQRAESYVMREDSRLSMREKQLGQPRLQCIHCGGMFRPAAIGRYHNDKCKLKA